MEREIVDKTIKDIKRSFREVMNGVTAQSMRDKGTHYKINWGASLQHLREMATEYGKDYDLAIALWKEPIRECKVLATLIMPAEKLLPEVADIWMEQTETQEVAELLALNLFQHVAFAPQMAYKYIATGKALYEICGFHVLSRLFAAGHTPDERGICELLDQAEAALCGDNTAVRHAAYNCLVRFAESGEGYEALANKVLRAAHLL